jgi:ABC-type transport system involved in cytochrome c biogenesis permease subunit
MPLVALLTGSALLVGLEPAGEPVAFQSGWFVLHIVFAFIGFSGLAVAFAAGLTYLLQHRQLKSKQFGAIFRFFPPLDTLDRLGRQGLLVGFPFLTLAVLLGWAWTANFAGSIEPGNPKLVWVVLSWLVFLSALLAGSGKGRKGERGALASVIGFVVVVVLYVIVRTQSAIPGSFL